MKRFGKSLIQILFYYLPASMISCGVNLQQSGYREKNDFLMVMGVLFIAAGIRRCFETRKELEKSIFRDSVENDGAEAALSGLTKEK
jgi:hypothetical protein